VLTLHTFPNTLADLVDIEVDVNHPERNREVNIFHFKDKTHHGLLHDGFIIEVEVDLRDFVSSNYSAHLISASKILVKMPAQTSGYLYDYQLVANGEAQANRMCESVNMARNLTRHKIVNDPERTFKYLMLHFPEHMSLSNVIYSPESSVMDVTIKNAITAYTATVNLPNRAPMVLSHRTRLSWKVNIVEEDERKFDNASSTTDAIQDEMDLMFASMKGMNM
jgi:hypothetical protein